MKIFYLLVLLFLVICSTSCTNNPENAIIDYLQVKNGIDAKLYDFKKVKEITVSDSVDYLKIENENILKDKIDSVQKSIIKYKKELSDGAKTILVTPTLRDAYATVITTAENTLDSLRNIKPLVPQAYNKRDSDETLAIVYSGRILSKKAALSYFILSPGGTTCYCIRSSLNK